MALVDDRARLIHGADEEARDLVDRLLRRREADSQQRLLGHLLQPLEREREVRAAPRADHRVDLVDDHRPDRAQHLAAAGGGQQQVQRLRCGDEDVRRRAEHRGALGGRRVAGTHRGRDPRRRESARDGKPRDARARLREVLVDVGAQRLQRRHVDDADLVGERRAHAVVHELVERGEERRERLARARRRGDQRVAPLANRRPAERLRARRLAERLREPLGDDWMKGGERHENR